MKLSPDRIEALMDAAAEAIWQAEWTRGGGRGPRRVSWADLSEKMRESYRVMSRAATAPLLTELLSLRDAMTQISAIRDSIIGFQNVGWSEHIYPLVAVLHEAGFEGVGYDEARKNTGRVLDALKAAEAELASLREPNERQGEALKAIAAWELPPSGRFWDDPEKTDPMSYGAAFGSNGERDFMRELARSALARTLSEGSSND